METLVELIKRIEDNLEEGWVRVKEIPKRCILNVDYGPKNVPGYLVTLHYTGCEGEEYIFISDIADSREFHHAPSLFETVCFRDRCRWVTLDEVEIEEDMRFFI